MNQDPVYQKLCEIGWRRPLTEAEQAELRAWLVTHPEAQAEVEADAALSVALEKLPDAPLPSNFTARVLQAIEREAVAKKRVSPGEAPWWRVWLPRFAVAFLLVGGGFFVWQNHSLKQQELTSAARQVANTELFSDPGVLTDFEVIASLSPAESVADEGLLAMSADLIELGK